MASPWGEDVPAELKAALARFDDLETQLREVWLAIMNADGGKLFPLDLYVQGAIKRSLSQIMGIRLMLENANLVCARALLRMQIDTAMRLHAAWITPDPHAFAMAVIDGKQVNELKCRNGRKLTDRYLARELTKEYEWVERVYESTSGYIHLSERQLMLIANTAPKGRPLTFVVAAHDTHMPIQSFVEVAECFMAASGIVLQYLDGWQFTKGNPELVVSIRKAMSNTAGVTELPGRGPPVSPPPGPADSTNNRDIP